MNPETLTALQGSIAKWEAIVAGYGVDAMTSNCPLCARFYDDEQEEGDECERVDGELCPVAESSGDRNCADTPYIKWASACMKERVSPRKATTPELVALAQAELDFLRSLLPTDSSPSQGGGK